MLRRTCYLGLLGCSARRRDGRTEHRAAFRQTNGVYVQYPGLDARHHAARGPGTSFGWRIPTRAGMSSKC